MVARWRDELPLLAIITGCPALSSGLFISGVTIGDSAVWKVLALALVVAIPFQVVYTLGLMYLYDRAERQL